MRKSKKLLKKTFQAEKTSLSRKISDHLKIFARSMKENENFSLKGRTLMGGWLSTAARIFRRDKNTLRKSFPCKFEDWIYKECSMKKQTIYNYKTLYKLMRLAPKLLNCRVNMTFLLKTTRKPKTNTIEAFYSLRV